MTTTPEYHKARRLGTSNPGLRNKKPERNFASLANIRAEKDLYVHLRTSYGLVSVFKRRHKFITDPRSRPQQNTLVTNS